MTIQILMIITALLIGFYEISDAVFMRNSYKIDVENVEICSNNDFNESPLRNLKYVKLNRTHKSLSYDITYLRPLDENVGSITIVDRWGDGGWINIPFMPFQKNTCKYVMKYFKDAWIAYVGAMGVEQPEKCPIPPGNYSLKDYIINFSTVQQPFWSGRFRLTNQAQTVDTRKNISCIIFFITLTEVV